MDLAIARLVLSLAFGIGIGIIMALIFHKEDLAHDKATDALFAGQAKMRRTAFIFLLALTVLLVAVLFNSASSSSPILRLISRWQGRAASRIFSLILYHLTPLRVKKA